MTVALVLCSQAGFGGAERRLLRAYAVMLREHEFTGCLFIQGDYSNFIDLINKLNLDISVFQHVVCQKSRIKLLCEVCKSDASVIHLLDISLTWSAIMLVEHWRRKKILLTISGLTASSGKLEDYRQNLAYWAWKHADHVDLLYPQFKENVLRFRGAKPLSCTPGTFTDLCVFQPAKKEKMLLFCAARLSAGKNPLMLVEALTDVAQDIRREGYRVVIAGRGYQEEQIKSKIHQAHLDDIVEMPGYIASQDYVVKAQVVFSLQTPNYPSQVVAEACASGCCVIATSCKEDPTTFLNPSFALFCDKNANSLAKTISYYLSLDEKQKSQLEKNARAHAEKYFNVENSAKYFGVIIENLLKR